MVDKKFSAREVNNMGRKKRYVARTEYLDFLKRHQGKTKLSKSFLVLEDPEKTILFRSFKNIFELVV